MSSGSESMFRIPFVSKSKKDGLGTQLTQINYTALHYSRSVTLQTNDTQTTHRRWHVRSHSAGAWEAHRCRAGAACQGPAPREGQRATACRSAGVGHGGAGGRQQRGGGQGPSRCGDGTRVRIFESPQLEGWCAGDSLWCVQNRAARHRLSTDVSFLPRPHLEGYCTSFYKIRFGIRAIGKIPCAAASWLNLLKPDTAVTFHIALYCLHMYICDVTRVILKALPYTRGQWSRSTHSDEVNNTEKCTDIRGSPRLGLYKNPHINAI